MTTANKGDQPKRTGIALLAHVLITRLLTLIALNLMFCVAVLPVVTLPNALAALYRCVGLVLKEEDFSLWKTFFRAFVSEFLKTLAVGWLVLLLLVGSIFGAVFYWSISTWYALAFTMFCVVMGIYLYAVTCNLFYMLSRVRLPFGALLKNAFLLVFLQPVKKTAWCLVSLALLAGCAWYAPRSLPIVILIACSLVAMIACFGVSECIENRIVSYAPLP